jgi:hypothetical protein
MTESKTVAKTNLIIAIVTVISMLLGCQSTDQTTDLVTTPVETKVAKVSTPTATPDDLDNTFESPISPIASPQLKPGQFEEYVSQVTPGPKGTVVGQFLDIITLQPISDIPVYLAMIEGEEEFPIAALNREKDPKAKTDIGGIFHFTSLESGNYVIVVGAEGTGGMIENNTTRTTLVINVRNGQVSNLGQIIIEHP